MNAKQTSSELFHAPFISRCLSTVTALISRHSLRSGALFDQRTGAVNDVASAHSVLDDTGEQPPDCFGICRLGEEQLRAASAPITTAQIGWYFGNRRR
jgi:hypothetical protein